MTTPKEIGKIFTEAREKRQMSLDKAAADSRIHPNVIRDIESGVFDRLGKLYIKSFMKKYASFLGIDPAKVLQEYESVSSKVHGKEFNISEEKEQKDETIDAMKDKKLQAVIAVILTVILVILVFVLFGMMRSRMSPRAAGPSAPVETAAARVDTAAQPAQEKKSPLSSLFSSVRKNEKEVTLSLKATGEVWLQISRGDEKVFSGFMKQGQTNSWTSEEPLTVWTGKADNLEFTVNNRVIGVIAGGVVKNIVVSPEGIKIGDEWVARL